MNKYEKALKAIVESEEESCDKCIYKQKRSCPEYLSNGINIYCNSYKRGSEFKEE